MKKAPEAFRTISEVAEILETPAHVLRFWESKFYQIRPVKRAGGRRYYRPDDVALINGIRHLLQDQGMTIRGVQRVLQEQGAKHVAGLAGPLPLRDPQDVLDDTEALDDFDDVDVDDVEDAEVITGDLSGTDAVTVLAPTLPAPEPEPAADVILADSRAPAALDAAVPGPVADDTSPNADRESEQTDDAQADHVEAVVLPAIPVTSDEDIMTESDDFALPEVPPAPVMPTTIATPRHIAAAAASIDDADDELVLASDPARLARVLRTMPRGHLGDRRDRLERIGRRIDGLLERMSEASGAGRW